MAKNIVKAAKTKSKGKMASPPAGMFKTNSITTLTPKEETAREPMHKVPDRKTAEQREAEAQRLAARTHRKTVAEQATRSAPIASDRLDPNQLAKEIEGFIAAQHMGATPSWPVISAALTRCSKNIQYGWTKFKERCDE